MLSKIGMQVLLNKKGKQFFDLQSELKIRTE